MKKHILLTGKPGVGKTTVIKKMLPFLGDDAGGFFTEEMSAMGKRMGFRVVTLDGEDGVLAHVDLNSTYQVGRYRVDPDAFEKLVIPVLENAVRDKPVIVIDEIGKMELLSMKFRELVSTILDSKRLLVAVIKEDGDPFTDWIKKRNDVTIVTVNHENRDTLPGEILEMIENNRKS
ncbi:MAG: NTPase [Candidatus Loosdrechtia sp.]|uniref:NTPase n=1 Tax=Candidatus Loosdrechtia sp. TaxID=3101272 RepID=UPI003A736094|nr:MAG: NTPase [Candidatus Jettenia sp. AMX2]